jgi:mannose-6-phosphate isomerase-like protein (cupin superfamily)
LHLCDHYCYKQIRIKAGHRTSYQYHREKYETNFVAEGRAEVWCDDEEGKPRSVVLEAGGFITVPPNSRHRVVAITDVVLMEVSTPHVDDVVRIEDDTNRPDGRIESEHLGAA